MSNEQLERQVMELIATDRTYIPVSSMDGKLKRQREKLAQAVNLGKEGMYNGDRVYARIETDDAMMKARKMADAIAQFAEEYPRHGQILKGLIEEERAGRETHLYFGVNPGSRLTADDYLGVMANLGFSETTSRNLYPEIIDASRTISKRKARADEERSVLVGKVLNAETDEE